MPRIVEHGGVGRVAQERCLACHRSQDATFAFHSQIFGDPRDLCHPGHQRCGLMGVQLVTDDMPASGLWISRDDGLHMRQKISLGSRWPAGRSQQLSSHHVAAENEGTRAMAYVFEFTTLDLPRCQGQSWMLAWKPPARRSIRQYSRSVRLAPSGEEHPDRRCKSLSPFLLGEHRPAGSTNSGSNAA